MLSLCCDSWYWGYAVKRSLPVSLSLASSILLHVVPASVPVHSTVFIDIIDSGSKELRSSIQRYFSISTPTGLYYDSDWCLEYDPIPMNAPLGLDKISPAPVATFQTASTPSNATAPPPSSSSSSSSNPLAETGGRKTEGAVIGLAAVTGVLALALLLAMRCHFRLRKGLRIAEKDRQTVTKAFPSQTRLGAPSMENPVLSRQQSFRAFNAKPAADFELFESPSSRWYTPDLFLRTKTSVTRLAGIQSGNHGPVMVSSRSEPDGETGEHLSMIDDQYSVLEPDQFPMPVLAPRHHQQVHTPVSHGSPLHSPDISSRSFAFSSRKAGPVPTITSGTSGTGISDDHYHRKKARSSPFFRWKYQA